MHTPASPANRSSQGILPRRVERWPSPLRHPGGKSWLLPLVRQWLDAQAERPSILVEPFAGGASVGLMAALEDRVDRVVLIEADPDVANFWSVLLDGDAEQLIAKVTRTVTPDDLHEVLMGHATSNLDQALRMLVRNRVNFGGNLTARARPVRRGERGRGLTSRWYPHTLADRMTAIATVRDRVTLVSGDAMPRLAELDGRRRVFFIDPPYTTTTSCPGHRLYRFGHIDHRRLFAATAELRGQVLLTYNYASEVQRLVAEHGFEATKVRPVGNRAKCAEELLISPSLHWLNK